MTETDSREIRVERDTKPESEPDYYAIAVAFTPKMPVNSAGHDGRWSPPLCAVLNPRPLAKLIQEISENLGKLVTQGKINADAPLTLEEAAHYLGVHYDTLYKWAVEQELIGWYDIGQGSKNAPRFCRRDLDSFVKTYRVSPVP